MNRRQFLYSAVGGVAATTFPTSISKAASPTAKLGIADFALAIRRRAERAGIVPKRLGSPLDYLKYCHAMGAGGVQCTIGQPDESQTKDIRSYLETNNMFIVGTARLPREASGAERFGANLFAAKRAGAKVVRVAIGGRRYEDYDTLEQYKAFARRSWKSLQLAEPVAAQHEMPLAIENHKDFRIEQMLTMLKQLDSEYVGVCVDTNNSVALLEDPLEVAKAYAPWAFSVHLKDMALCEYEDGFLLADIPLGEGIIDLAEIVRILRAAKPDISFNLEMSTRDPLKVPCLTEKYWATFENVPPSDLARALRCARSQGRPRESLLSVSPLPLAEQVKLEEEINRKCLAYASKHLNL